LRIGGLKKRRSRRITKGKRGLVTITAKIKHGLPGKSRTMGGMQGDGCRKNSKMKEWIFFLGACGSKE